MAFSTTAIVCRLTLRPPLITRETVAGPTPALWATSIKAGTDFFVAIVPFSYLTVRSTSIYSIHPMVLQGKSPYSFTEQVAILSQGLERNVMQNLNRRQFTKSLLGAPALATQAARVEPQTTMMAAVWQKQAPGIWRASIGTSEEHTPVRSRLIASKATAAITDAASHTPLLRVEGKVTKRGTFLRLPLEADELMYGFGLQLQSFQQRGKKRTIRVNADPKGDSGDSHAPVPFYVTTRGYGILVDTFRNVSFACGNSQPVPASAVDATGL